MSPPVRAHLISLSLGLGLTVFLVWGQIPTHFTLNRTTVTGPIPITSVGNGTTGNPSLICYTTDVNNTVWLFPDRSMIAQVTNDTKATDTFIFRRVSTKNYVLLRRGPSVRSPGGDYCCGSATNVNERLCINLVVDCEMPPSIPNGSPGTPNSTLLGRTVTYTCNNGYQIALGNIMATASCLATGNWENVTCSVIDCGLLTDPANGGVTTPSGTTFINNATATYNCTAGYNLTGHITRACSSDGVWTLAEPSCPPVDCGSLTAPLNGTVNVPVTTFMNTATYSCNTGYSLTGSTTRTCDSNGMWTLTEPSCPPVDCGSLIAPPNGTVTTPSGTTFMNIAKYSCTTGYILIGDMTRTCGSDGVWTVAEPSCISSGGSAVAGNSTGVIIGIVLFIIAVILIVAGIILTVLVLRKMRDNRKRYANSVDKRSPPETLLPYTTTYTKPTNGEETVNIFEATNFDPSIVEFPSDMKATEGEEVYLKVKVTGHPSPTITWYRNGMAVKADYATELDEDGGISFPSIETKHSGVYKIVVTGPSGASEEKQLELTVLSEGERTDSGDSGIGSSDYNPVPVPQFGLFINDCHGNNNQKFRDLYKSLDSGENGHTTIVSKQNKDSNRFGNISVYDDNMIVLQPITGQEDCQSDYINASYVDGYSIRKKFIAAQGPIPCTLVDFWRMIWQERPTAIVMVTNLMEGEKIKCEPYWPESGKMNFGPFTVTITDQQVFADYTVRTLQLSFAGDRHALKVTQFHFTSWPDHGVPEYATPVLAFHRRVRSHHNPSKGPLLVHCSAGVGRTGTYIVIDNVLEQIEAEKVVDISGAIVRARNQRMKIVQTEKQYVFIHDAILEFVTCGDTQISAGDLRKSIQKLSRKDSTKHITGFEQQFKILEQVSPNPNEISCVTANRHLELNRGNKFLPSENNRLILRGEQPDYINAVFAHGYKHQKAFIIAQNPLPSTVRNFWKVVYDRKCAAVVMLSPIMENKKEVCTQYWPKSGVGSYGEYTVENLGKESIPGFTIRSLSVHAKKSKSSHQVTQFHVTNWTEDGVIANLKIVTDVNEEVVKVQRRTGNKPILVHCTDTVTRSGIFCAISTTIDRCKSEGVVDVFQVVKALRIHKPGAVPSVELYQTVFGAILVFLDSFDNYANFS